MAKPTKLQRAILEVRKLDDEAARLHGELKAIHGKLRDIKGARENAENAVIVLAVREKYDNPQEFLENVLVGEKASTPPVSETAADEKIVDIVQKEGE